MGTEIKKFSGALKYGGKKVVLYDISYPVFFGAPSAERISIAVKNESLSYIKRRCFRIYPSAKKQALLMGDGFSPFVINAEVQIMFEHNDIISFFTDYFFDGGFCGRKTVRRARTYDINTGKRIVIKDIFKSSESISGLLSALYEQMPSFEEETGLKLNFRFKNRCAESIEKNRFYLADDGIALFLPQGSITADVWGIPTFLIPFSRLEHKAVKRFL